MTTIQVRDVPDEVAGLIAEKAKAQNLSTSAYLRQLMAQDVEEQMQIKAMREWRAEVRKLQEELGLPRKNTTSSVDIIREIRNEYI